MLIVAHPQHDALALLRYDPETGFVTAKMTGLAEQAAVTETFSLAEFLNRVGIPVPAPTIVPEPTAA